MGWRVFYNRNGADEVGEPSNLFMPVPNLEDVEESCF